MNAPTWAALPEADLVDLAISGSAPAFGELAERHRDKLRRHFAFHTKSLDDAEDLTQEVFCNAWRAIGRFRRTNAPFVAWLMTIAHNLLVDRARAGAARREVSFVHPVAAGWMGRDGDGDASALLVSEDRWSDPAAMAELGEGVARLRAALAAMDERHPQRHFAVALRYLGGFEYGDLARLMGKTEGCVRVTVHRGIGDLRARLVAGEVSPYVA